MSLNSIVRRGYASSSLDAIVRRGYAAYTGLPQPPPSGYQYETCSTTSYTGYSLQAGSSPVVVAGDVFVASLLTLPSSFAVTINNDGTLDIASGGNTNRQEVLYGIYRITGNALDPGNFPASTGVAWINEVGPSWTAPVVLPNGPAPILVGVAITPVVLQSPAYASSQEGDTLTFVVAAGSLPPGISISGTTLAGAPTTVGTYSFALTATDITGTSATSALGSFTISPNVAIVPNVIGSTLSAALAVLALAGFSSVTYTSIYSAAPAGTVVTQNPPGNAAQPTGTPIALVISLGLQVFGVVPPPQDTGGAALNAQMLTVNLLVAAAGGSIVLPQLQDQLNRLQVQLVDHYMVTGWLNAATILASYQPPPNDKVGQSLVARVAFLQNLVNNAPAMPPGNANGYGGAGWTTLAVSYQQMLYAKQIQLVEHIMDVPGGTSAATILYNMTGFQSFPFEYSFNSVGFTDAWIDD